MVGMAALASMTDIDDRPHDKLDHDTEASTVYRLRWWTLAVFSLFTFLQGWFWAIPGTISPVYMEVNGVSNTAIQLLVNWGPITFIPLSVPMGIWIDVNLRLSTITSIALVAAGALLRCFALDDSLLSLVLLHISYILNGCAGPVAMGAVSLLAERFFPLTERSTATAIAAEANSFGLAAAFLVGPNMITSSSNKTQLLQFYILCAVLIGALLVRRRQLLALAARLE
jgi:MFS family permease